MYNDVITLLTITETPNAIGDLVESVTRKDVFAQVKSIGMRETYEAKAAGLKPELTFLIADYYDYGNQEYIEYETVRYNVVRTYRRDSNELEIVVARVIL